MKPVAIGWLALLTALMLTVTSGCFAESTGLIIETIVELDDYETPLGLAEVDSVDTAQPFSPLPPLLTLTAIAFSAALLLSDRKELRKIDTQLRFEANK